MPINTETKPGVKPAEFMIIDGSSLIHREYYASLPVELRGITEEAVREQEYWRLNQSGGHYINAIDGFVAELISYKYYQKADYIAVCLDENRQTTFRRQQFPEYKAQRSPTPAPLEDQMHYIREICIELGIPVFSDPLYEADDFAGSIAKKFASDNVHVDLVTTDRDYFQLVNENISCCLMCQKDRYDDLVEQYGRRGAPIGSVRFNKFMIKEETGVWPNQITDWKGMSGDASDNIPGIRGVSDKTVIPLLEKYHSLNKVLEAVENTPEAELKKIWKEELGINRPPVTAFKNDIEENKAYFCKQLATIKTDISVPERLEAYTYDLDLDKVIDISDRLGLIKPFDVLNKLSEREMTTPDMPDEEAEMEEEPEFDAFGDF